MLSAKDYAKFNIKFSRILRDCLIDKLTQDIVDQDQFEFVDHGRTSQTKDNTYYYNRNSTKHNDELIELCRTLPKLQHILLGTAGTIPFSSLISDTNVPALFRKQLITADHFINLISYNGIAVAKENRLQDGTIVTHLNLDYSLADRLKEKTGQEYSDY